MYAQQLVSVMGKNSQVNPMLMKNDMSFAQSLYDTGVAPLQGAVTNKNKDMFQNQQRIQSMISNNENLDYVSKKGFLKYEAISTTVDIVIVVKFNTLYTIKNANPPPLPSIDVAVDFQDETGTVLNSVIIGPDTTTNFFVNGVAGTPTPLQYIDLLAGNVTATALSAVF